MLADFNHIRALVFAPVNEGGLPSIEAVLQRAGVSFRAALP
ncbi:hypothetical protein Z950_3481 [Sulfitobacter mediterraneus KCTC 32188]|nr:hypothetical protein Z950_3481 [Sulfitobacter mediterraneus KCTC 32188]